MAKGGTKIYCPNCNEFQVCAAVSPTQVGESKAQRWYIKAHKDISWFRRARLCLTCDKTFLSAEIDEKLLEELIQFRDKIADLNKSKATKIRRGRPWLSKLPAVSLDFAQNFIRQTAWWHTHSSGKPVRAPKHADHVYLSKHGWAIDFGANTFLVGTAITRCSNLINSVLDQFEAGEIPNIGTLKEQMELQIRGSVANMNGHEYAGYYPIDVTDMMFGAQSIDVKNGVDFLVEQSGVMELLS